MSIYNYTDYIKYIQEIISANSSIRGYQSRLSEAAKVHNSYFSKVLSGAVDLTLDQAIQLADFWHFNQEEKEYLICLVNYRRAGVQTLKNVLQKQIETLQKNYTELSKRLKQAKVITPEKQLLYYSLWYYCAIHMLLLIPEYQNVDILAKRLALEKKIVVEALNVLQEIGLIRKNGENWKVTENDLHLSNKALWGNLFHANWRQRTSLHLLNNLNRIQDNNELHFSSLYAISKKDFKLIKDKFIDLIEKTREIAQKSKEEEVYFFSVDAFEL